MIDYLSSGLGELFGVIRQFQFFILAVFFAVAMRLVYVNVYIPERCGVFKFDVFALIVDSIFFHNRFCCVSFEFAVCENHDGTSDFLIFIGQYCALLATNPPH